MKFWDSSALVPLIVEEASSSRCRDLLRRDRTVVVWCLTRTEIVSALARREREGRLRASDFPRAVARLDFLASAWTEISAVDPCKDTAERLLRTHPLRAAGALQLAAALVAFDGKPRKRAFVTLDGGLYDAAAREGFDAARPA